MAIERPKALIRPPLPLAEGQAEPLTLEEIFVKFPPAIEIFDDPKTKTSFFLKVSRDALKDDNGGILYMVPPTREDFKNLPLRTFIPKSRSLMIRDVSV